MLKRILLFSLTLALALSLCACGGEPAAPAAATEAPVTPAAASPEAAAPETPAPSPAEEGIRPALPDAGLHEAGEKPTEDPQIAARRELALRYLEKDAADLIEELGEPLERSYAPSCLGSGEDGELRYEGFTVYTYREGDRETVKDVS